MKPSLTPQRCFCGATGWRGWLGTTGSADSQITCRDPLGQEDPAPYDYQRADHLRRDSFTLCWPAQPETQSAGLARQFGGREPNGKRQPPSAVP
jgi:hypothetical protein